MSASTRYVADKEVVIRTGRWSYTQILKRTAGIVILQMCISLEWLVSIHEPAAWIFTVKINQGSRTEVFHEEFFESELEAVMALAHEIRADPRTVY